MIDLLVKTGVGIKLGAGTAVAGSSPYPSNYRSTIVGTLASRSHYSLPKFRKVVAESQEQFGGLEMGNKVAGIDVPLTQEAEGNAQSSGIMGPWYCNNDGKAAGQAEVPETDI